MGQTVRRGDGGMTLLVWYSASRDIRNEPENRLGGTGNEQFFLSAIFGHAVRRNPANGCGRRFR